MTYLMQNSDGQITEPHSVSAGLDYPGIGPIHAHLRDTNRVEYHSITDSEALQAGMLLARTTGIIPALESAHALAILEHIQCNSGDNVVVNLSGRGDKDLSAYERFMEFNKSTR
jgi:tryptophan synthase beta subunit